MARGCGTQTVFPTSHSTRTTGGLAPQNECGDMVTIPEVAKRRHETDAEEPDRPEEASTAAAPTGGLPSKLVPLLTPEELADKTEAVRSDIAALFLAKDIPTTPPAKRYVAQADAVRVKGDHPHKAEIEQAPAKDEASSKDFRPGSASRCPYRQHAPRTWPRGLRPESRRGGGPVRLPVRRSAGRPVHHVTVCGEEPRPA